MYSSKQVTQTLQGLEHILQSEGFASAPQLRKFLRFIVTKTLDGQTSEIKGYTIGVDALGRPANFDPHTDPIVRVMAGRLRQALKNYYAEYRDGEFPIIVVRKGRYVPEFDYSRINSNQIGAQSTTSDQVRQASPSRNFGQLFSFLTTPLACLATLLAAAALWFTLTPSSTQIVPSPPVATIEKNATRISLSLKINDDPIPTWFSAQEALAGLETAFSRFSEFVISHAPEAGAKPAQPKIHSDYHFSALIAQAGTSSNVRAFTKLIRQHDNTLIWSKVVEIREPIDQTGIDASKLAGQVISPLLSPYGVIYADITNNRPIPAHLDCINKIYAYFSAESQEKYADARACVNQTIARGSASSSIYALLTFLQIEVYRKKISGFEIAPLEAAEKSSQLAISAGPQNARAHQARFGIHKILGNTEEAIAAAQIALNLNPFDSDIAGDIAAYLISIGELNRAAPILNKAVELNPTKPVWLQFYRFLNAELLNQPETADQIASTLNPGNSPMAAIAVAISAHRQGDNARLVQATKSLLSQEPDFIVDPQQSLLRRGFSKDVALGIAARLKNTGMPELIPELSAATPRQ